MDSRPGSIDPSPDLMDTIHGSMDPKLGSMEILRLH